MNPFRPADKHFAKEPPDFLSEYFTADKRPVCEIAGEGLNISSDKFINYGIESSMVDSELGTCTHRHRDVVYTEGFEHPTAITLARLGSHLVDAPKAGLRLRLDKWNSFLNNLRVNVPEYIKPKGERRNFNSPHVMDVLVLQVIPEFLNRVLTSFNEQVGGDAVIPIDPDIKSFYEKIKSRRPQLVDTLKSELLRLQQEWKRCIGKKLDDKSRNREEHTCSPTKKQKTIRFGSPPSPLVPPLHPIVDVRTNCTRNIRGLRLIKILHHR